MAPPAAAGIQGQGIRPSGDHNERAKDRPLAPDILNLAQAIRREVGVEDVLRKTHGGRQRRFLPSKMLNDRPKRWASCSVPQGLHFRSSSADEVGR